VRQRAAEGGRGRRAGQGVERERELSSSQLEGKEGEGGRAFDVVGGDDEEDSLAPRNFAPFSLATSSFSLASPASTSAPASAGLMAGEGIRERRRVRNLH